MELKEADHLALREARKQMSLLSDKILSIETRGRISEETYNSILWLISKMIVPLEDLLGEEEND